MPNSLDTRLIHAGQPPLDEQTAPVNVPVVRTSTVRFSDTDALYTLQRRRAEGDPVSLYGRHGTQTHRALEQAICELEGGRHAYLVPSGLAAISLALLALADPGDHILVIDSVYQPVRKFDDGIARRFGIEVSYFNPSAQAMEDHLRPNTKVVYAECPGSILFEMIDLRAMAEVTRARGIALVVDNTWASGYLFNPLATGADVSLLAGTKYISGHSDVMIGALVAKDAGIAQRISRTQDLLGLVVSSDDAYLALRGLRTLGVRLAQHERNALEVAAFLASHDKVERVYYPPLPEDPGHALWRRDFRGGNGLLSVSFRDFSTRQIDAAADALKLFGIGASWGGYESLVLPVGGDRLDVHGGWKGKGGVLRLHIGLEDPKDLIDDLRLAIDRAAASTA